MDTDELTLGQLKEIKNLMGGGECSNSGQPYKIGCAYFIRTVTHYLTGRVTAVTDKEIVLEDAAWIADTGRYADALKTGSLKEVEPYPDGPVIVGRGAVIDVAVWSHPLPREQK